MPAVVVKQSVVHFPASSLLFLKISLIIWTESRYNKYVDIHLYKRIMEVRI